MAEEKKKHINWGGKREGSGRKKVLYGQTHKVATALGEDVYEWVISHKEETTSAFIHRILKERMEQEQENQ